MKVRLIRGSDLHSGWPFHHLRCCKCPHKIDSVGSTSAEARGFRYPARAGAKRKQEIGFSSPLVRSTESHSDCALRNLPRGDVKKTGSSDLASSLHPHAPFYLRRIDEGSWVLSPCKLAPAPCNFRVVHAMFGKVQILTTIFSHLFTPPESPRISSFPASSLSSVLNCRSY